MRIPTLATVLAIPVLLALVACDREVPSLEQASSKISAALEELNPDRIEELAKLAARIEKDPTKAEALLKEHGLDREQFQKVVDKIQSDPNLKKLFEKAKELAKNAK